MVLGEEEESRVRRGLVGGRRWEGKAPAESPVPVEGVGAGDVAVDDEAGDDEVVARC